MGGHGGSRCGDDTVRSDGRIKLPHDDQAGGRTGQNLQVNGGLTLRGNPSRDDIQRSIIAAAQG